MVGCHRRGLEEGEEKLIKQLEIPRHTLIPDMYIGRYESSSSYYRQSSGYGATPGGGGSYGAAYTAQRK